MMEEVNFWNTYWKTPMLESHFNKVVGLQDCFKTYLLHALLRFYFSSDKTTKFH